MTEPEPADEFDDDDSLPLRELRRLAGGRCIECGTRYSARDAVGSVALGFKSAPRCHACLSRRLGRDAEELRAELIAYVHRRECFLKAWREAERMDGGTEPALVPPFPLPPLPPEEGGTSNAILWNAGGLGCGELVMELRLRLAAMSPGGEIEVTATDPAAPEDIPSWCRMTGHPLVTATHPRYLIRRKEK